ncbi:unnamed protein product [Ectocarpus sp. 6 AP-2014]
MLNRDRPKLGQRRRSPQATCFSALELRRYRTFHVEHSPVVSMATALYLKKITHSPPRHRHFRGNERKPAVGEGWGTHEEYEHARQQQPTATNTLVDAGRARNDVPPLCLHAYMICNPPTHVCLPLKRAAQCEGRYINRIRS